MLIEIIIASLVGILFGTFTGLIPGIHINLVGVLLISLAASALSVISPIYIAIFVVAMAITHTFVDFIPSIFLGCPDTDTELSILPGHELLKQGKGHEAIMLTTYGSLAAILLLILISVPSIALIPKVYEFIKDLIPYILIFILIILIILEKNKIAALIVLSLTGILGLSVLNSPVNEPLLPLLTGLFGGSMLVTSIKNKVKIPKQNIENPHVTKREIFKPLMGALIASPLCSFLPGLGSGQAAVIGNTISKTDKKGFLILLGATNTLVMGFSFISLYVILKTRTGAAVALQEILGQLTPGLITLILIISTVVGITAFFLTKNLTKFFSRRIEKVSYSTLSVITLIILLAVTLSVSGILGAIILTVSTITGIYCISLGVRRTHMMGCLLIPTILLYLL
jgi:putative membrane protein